MTLEELREQYPPGARVLVDGRHRGTVVSVEATYERPLIWVRIGLIPAPCGEDDVRPLAEVDDLSAHRARHRRR